MQINALTTYGGSRPREWERTWEAKKERKRHGSCCGQGDESVKQHSQALTQIVTLTVNLTEARARQHTQEKESDVSQLCAGHFVRDVRSFIPFHNHQ